MKYKLGDKVKVKNQKWYKENKDADEIVRCDGFAFFSKMVDMCGKAVTIKRVHQDCYDIEEFPFPLTDPMIEGLAEAREIPVEHPCDWLKRGLNLPDGYEFQDENGNVINTKKITLVKKKPKYPTTYEECCKLLSLTPCYNVSYDYYRGKELNALYHLLVCRDAYWKIAGEEMGLGKTWEPDWSKADERKCCIVNTEGKIVKWVQKTTNKILSFPTEEVRDAFYENFKELIVSCKELL